MKFMDMEYYPPPRRHRGRVRAFFDRRPVKATLGTGLLLSVAVAGSALFGPTGVFPLA